MAKQFIAPEEVEARASEFLAQYHSDGTLPIPIEEIIDFQLSIDIVPTPGMMTASGVDAVTSHDMKQINIDQEQLEKTPNRARFSLAHEVGHIVLHKDFIQSRDFKSEASWREFVLNDVHRDPLEVQANMFAAFVLMPTAQLEREFESEKSDLANKPQFRNQSLPADNVLAPYLAKPLARTFEVSEEAMSNRLNKWLQNRSRKI